jgi:hypothetical protein
MKTQTFITIVIVIGALYYLYAHLTVRLSSTSTAVNALLGGPVNFRIADMIGKAAVSTEGASSGLVAVQVVLT